MTFPYKKTSKGSRSMMTVCVLNKTENEQLVDQTSDAGTTLTKGSSIVAPVAVASAKPSCSSSRKRVIDETLLSPNEARKLQSRRAYNRDCATRARMKSKQCVAQLQEEVKELNESKDELRRSYAVMKAKCDVLEQQNQALMLKQVTTDRHNALLAASNFMPRQASMKAFSLSDLCLAGLQGEAAAQARRMYQQGL